MVAAEVAEVDRVVDVGGAAAAAVLGVRGVLHLGDRHGRVLDAEVGDRRRSRPRSAISGSSAFSTSRVGGGSGGDDRRPAVGDRLELAVAVELIAEQVAQQQRRGLELGGDPVEPELVDLEQPELAVDRAARAGPRPAASRRSPPAMFAPARLWTSAIPARSRIEATIAAVVVLPLVAEMTTEPRGSRAASSPIARARARISTLPGRLVPPPRPARRASSPTARAAAIFAAQPRHPRAPARGRAPGSARTVTGSSAIGSPSAYRVNGRSALICTSGRGAPSPAAGGRARP